MSIFAKISESFVKDILVWVVPTLTIPAIRYGMETKPEKQSLFFRDLFSFGVGALNYFVFKGLSQRALKNTALQHKDVIATAIGMVGYVVLSTTGVLKLTQKMDKVLGVRGATAVSEPKPPVSLSPPRTLQSSPLPPVQKPVSTLTRPVQRPPVMAQFSPAVRALY